MADDAEAARRLDAIREVLTHFDWEHDDRQLALEAIDRIADGASNQPPTTTAASTPRTGTTTICDYAEKHHRHYDLESDGTTARRRCAASVDEAGRELRRQASLSAIAQPSRP